MTKKSPDSSKIYSYGYYGRYNLKLPIKLVSSDYESTSGNFHQQNPFYTRKYECNASAVRLWQYGSPTDDYRAAPVEISFETETKFNTVSTCKSIASSKFLNKLSTQDFDLGVFLGEYRETCDYIYDKAKPLVGAIRAYRSNDKKKMFSSLGIGNRRRKRIQRKAKAKAVGNSALQRDLEFKFAITPIVNDIQALRNLNFDVYPSWTIGSSHSEHAIYERKFGTGGYVTETFSYNCLYKARIVGVVTVKNFAVYTLSQFGMTSPVTTFYQVMPLSFLYDIFVPVANWSKQFSSLDGLSLRECCISIQGNEKVDYLQVRRQSWSGDFDTYNLSAHADQKYRKREINFQPSVRFPRYDDRVPFEAEKLFSLCEVIIQLCKGKNK